MYYINSIPTENGNYGNPQSSYADGFLTLPDELLPEYLAAKGFVFLTVIEDVITAVPINQEAYDAYIAGHPDNGGIFRASRGYEPGEYLTIDGVMYKVLLPIFAGSPITPGTNVTETTIEAEMANINREEN